METWPNLQLVTYGRNQGKGYAVKQGMLAAKGEHRVLSDADLSAPIEEMNKLRAKLEGRCQVAIGSRALRESEITTHQELRRELMGKTYNFFFQLLAIRGIHDSQCGFKAFTAEAAQKCFGPLRTKGFGFDAEVLLRAKKAGYKVAEVPVRWGHVEQSRVSKVRDSARMLWDLICLRIKGV
jgi:dolichyl-phosphate beta-glucosyltransferase